MVVLGGLLIILAIPLLVGYFVGEKRNKSWRNLGAIMGIAGLLVMLAGGIGK
jgi:drug/metabolite transporter superfamily protein YnfA